MNPKMIRAYAVKLTADRGLKVTIAEAEAEITETVMRVARNHAANFRFGYHGIDDMMQQGVLYALEALADDRYDVARPLENFLHVHVRNRLSNYKRDNFVRAEAPCSCCEPFNPPREPCRRWHEWSRRNASKRALMRPVDMGSVPEPDLSDPAVPDQAAARELAATVEAGLPAELRSDYLRMRTGAPVPKARRLRVRAAVAMALGMEVDDGG